MKKGIKLTILILALSATVCAQVRDRIRISYSGFNCNSETSDNALEMDGKGDEIFIQCNWVMADAGSRTEFEGKYRSPIHGDINHHNGWIKVGSRSDLGGIQSGDQYRTNTAIGEFEISDGEVFSIVPTIWEWDGNQDFMNTFIGFFDGNINMIKDRSLQLSRGFAQTLNLNNSNQTMFDFSKVNISPVTMAVNEILGQAKDRPIGLDAAGRFSPKTIVLTRDMMRKVASRNLGYGLGVLQVDYDENQLGNTRDHGAYTLLIKVEYLGSTGTPTTGGQVGNNGTNNGGVHYVPRPTSGGSQGNNNGNAGPGGSTSNNIPPPNGNAHGSSGNFPPPVTNNTGKAGNGTYVPPPNGNGNAHGTGGNFPPPVTNNTGKAGNGTYVPPPNGNGNAHGTGGNFPPPVTNNNTGKTGSGTYVPPPNGNGNAHGTGGNFPPPVTNNTGKTNTGNNFPVPLPGGTKSTNQLPENNGGIVPPLPGTQRSTTPNMTLVKVPAVTGNWKGTYGSGNNAGPNALQFQLNADGSLLLVSPNRMVLARGSYTVSNNILHANYRLQNGNAISFTGLVNSSQMSGTWGQGGSENNGGRWILAKQ